jgi:hypothetical protein
MALWGNKDSKTATGTVSIANTGVVTGSSTVFTTQAKVGNALLANGVEYQIVSITSNTVAKVIMGTNNGNGTVTTCSAQSYTLSEKPVYVAHQSADSFSGGNSSLVFGVDATESAAGGDNVSAVSIASGKTRYLEVPAVTFSGGGGSSAAATASISGGAVSSIAVTNTGTAYTSAPTVAIAKPRRTISVAAGGSATITQATDTIPYTAHGLVANEEVKYNNGGGTSATGLVSTTSYFVANAGLTANAFEVKAAATSDTLVATVATSGTAGQFTCGASTLAVGDRVKITGTNTGTGTITGYATGNTYKVSAVTGTSPSVTGFTLTTEAAGALVTTAGTLVGLTYTTETVIDISGAGTDAQFFEIQATADLATATAALGDGAVGGSQHSGWVRRTVGTGGRAGRVQYETLVAMGSITGDQSDDIAYRDS